MDPILAYLKSVVEGHAAIEPWETWFARNEQSLAALLNRGQFLRLKLRREEAIPDTLKRFGIQFTPPSRYDAERLRTTAERMGLSKQEVDEIRDIMENKDGNLTAEQFVDKHFKRDRTEAERNMSNALPTWSTEHIRAVLLFTNVAGLGFDDWQLRGVARRFTLNDAAELGTFLSLQARFNWMFWANRWTDQSVSVWQLLLAMAARDRLLVERLMHMGPFPLNMDAPGTAPLYNGVYAVVNREFEYLRSLVPALSKPQKLAWIQSMRSCLVGIAAESPDLVSESLRKLLSLYRRTFSAQALEKTICFWAHGLFELALSVSPELVSRFDTESSLPWDADFQKWARGCDSPLKDVTFEHTSPAIHSGIMTLSRPTWWDAHPQ